MTEKLRIDVGVCIIIEFVRSSVCFQADDDYSIQYVYIVINNRTQSKFPFQGIFVRHQPVVCIR